MNHLTAGLIAVSWIAVDVTVMVPEEAVTLPPDPVAVIVYVTVALAPVGTTVGVTVTVPFRATDPVQLPSVEDAVTVVAFVVVIVSARLLPCATVVTEGTSVAVGAGAFTVRVALAVVVPPAFVALMVYVAVPVAVGVTVTLPVRLVLVVRPGPETDALAAVLPAFHAMTVEPPSVMMPGVAVIVGTGFESGLIVTVAVPVGYSEIVDVAVMVAVVIAVIVEEAVNAPADVIVPAVVGFTDQVTTWLGLSCPVTVAVKEVVPPAERVAVLGLTVTEVALVVVPPPLALPEPPPQPASTRMVETMPRQNSLDA